MSAVKPSSILAYLFAVASVLAAAFFCSLIAMDYTRNVAGWLVVLNTLSLLIYIGLGAMVLLNMKRKRVNRMLGFALCIWVYVVIEIFIFEPLLAKLFNHFS